jgi:hypothetical protein
VKWLRASLSEHHPQRHCAQTGSGDHLASSHINIQDRAVSRPALGPISTLKTLQCQDWHWGLTGFLLEHDSAQLCIQTGSGVQLSSYWNMMLITAVFKPSPGPPASCRSMILETLYTDWLWSPTVFLLEYDVYHSRVQTVYGTPASSRSMILCLEWLRDQPVLLWRYGYSHNCVQTGSWTHLVSIRARFPRQICIDRLWDPPSLNVSMIPDETAWRPALGRP